jgi:hypothetical protein
MTVTDGRRKRPSPGCATSPGSDGPATRPADLLHVELWYNILRPVLADLFAILLVFATDLFATLSVLASLQVLHLVVDRLSLPEWFKKAFYLVHEYGSLTVITILVIGFIFRIGGRTIHELRRASPTRGRGAGGRRKSR